MNLTFLQLFLSVLLLVLWSSLGFTPTQYTHVRIRSRLPLDAGKNGDASDDSKSSLSKVESLVSKLKANTPKRGGKSMLEIIEGREREAGSGASAKPKSKYSDFEARPKALNATSILPGSFNQSFWNASSSGSSSEGAGSADNSGGDINNNGDDAPKQQREQQSALENRAEVELSRRDLLSKLGGARANVKDKDKAEAEGKGRGSSSSSTPSDGGAAAAAAAKLVDALSSRAEEGDSSTQQQQQGWASPTPSGSGSGSGIPTLQEAYGELPRWLLSPLLRLFNSAAAPAGGGMGGGDADGNGDGNDEESGSNNELYEIAAVLALRQSLRQEAAELDIDAFQASVADKYRELLQMRSQPSSSSSSSSSFSSSSSSSSLASSPSLYNVPGVTETEGGVIDSDALQRECLALVESLDRLEGVDAGAKAELKTKLLSLLERVDSALKVARSASSSGDPREMYVPGSPPLLDAQLLEGLGMRGIPEGERGGDKDAGDGNNSNGGEGGGDGDTPKEADIRTAIQNILVQVEDDADTTAERLIKQYFDPVSRQGVGVSREGAGRFQREVLSELFVVNSVKQCDGATIFEGKPLAGAKEGFGERLRERVMKSSVAGEVDYTLVMNEKVPNFDDGFERAALDVLLGSSPAVVVFPKSWNSTISVNQEQTFSKAWQSFLSSAAVVSSGIFAGTCYNLFEVDGRFAQTGELPVDFLPLALAPVVIQLLSSVSEAAVGALRGVRVATLTIPTLTLSNFGSRTVYDNMPRDRNEMFDLALAGSATALLSSMALMVYGVLLTAQAPADQLALFPSLPVSLISVNSVVKNVFAAQFPGLGDSGSSSIDVSSIHLHWLAIVGAVSFIANSLQLLPIDNSAGSKFSYAVLGRDNFEILNVATSLFKFLFIIPMIFNLGGVGGAGTAADTAAAAGAVALFTTQRVLLDYVVASQLATNSDPQIAVDNLEDVSEGRKIIFAGLVSLLVYCYFPFEGARQLAEWATAGGPFATAAGGGSGLGGIFF
jgi:hypothetical protein